MTRRLIECLSSAIDVALATTSSGDRTDFLAKEYETFLAKHTGIRALDAVKLAIAAERSSADIFHLVGTNALLFSPICKFSGAKGRIVRHVFTPYDRTDEMIAPVRRIMNRGFIDAYAFTSPWIGRWAGDVASSARKFVLRPPIDCDLYRPLSGGGSPVLESNGHVYSLLYMGPLWRSRFPSVNVLSALKSLIAEGFDAHLTIIASASRTTLSQIEEILSLVRSMSLERQVALMRRDLTEQERVQAYNDADLVVFPYVGPEPEQLADPPFGILESMACGGRVLATDVLSIPEVITNGENGFLITSTSIDNLRRGIRAALESEEKEELAARARQQVLREFGYPAIRQDAINLYRNLS